MAERLLRKYYLDYQCPCSTVMLRAARELGWIKCDQESLLLLESFCKTYHSDDICGAYTGALAILHVYLMQDPGKSGYAEDISESLRMHFVDQFGSARCSSIKLSQSKQDVGCLNVFRASFEMLDEFVQHLRVDAFQRHSPQQYYGKETNYV